MILNLVLILLHGHLIMCQNVNNTFNSTKDVINQIFTVDAYDQNELPTISHEPPRIIKPGVFIKDIFDISEQGASFSVRYYFSLNWVDERFLFTPFEKDNETVNLVKLPVNYIKDKGR